MINRNTLLVEAHRFLVDMQSNQQRYMEFLSTMSKYHKYDLIQQINLFFHAPAGSVAIAPAETWEKLHRSLKPDAKAIPILEGTRNREEMRFVYDVSDTNEHTPADENLIWQFDEARDAAYMDEHFPGTGTMQERVTRICKMMAENSGARAEDKELLGLSAAYIVLSRLGYDADDLEMNLVMMDFPAFNAEEVLGQVNQMTQSILNPLGEHIRKEQKNERTAEHEQSDAERDGDRPLEGPVGVREGSLFEEGETRDVEGARGDGEGGRVPEGHRGGVRGEGDAPDESADGAERGDGGAEAERPDAVDRDHDLRPASDGGDSGSGAAPVSEEAEEEPSQAKEPVDAEESADIEESASDADDVPEEEPLPEVDYEADLSTVSGKRKVLVRNIEAIRLMKRLEEQEREATPEEQKLLQSYAGFGGLPEAFDKFNTSWTKEYQQLREVLSESEYRAARASTLNAHYTPDALVQSIYKGLEHMGFHAGNILEPASGSGKFFQNMPEEMRQKSNLFGVELDPLSARIAAKAHPDVQELNAPYEGVDVADGSFDLAISNVPFGDYRVTADPRYKEGYLIHDYFLNKMTDQVRPGGLVVAITATGTMDKLDASAREDLARKAELVTAYRLPNTTFAEDGTKTPADILIFKKREKELDKNYFTEHENEKPEWVTSRKLLYAGYGIDDLPINLYFNNKENGKNVLGKIVTESSAHGYHSTCIPNPEEEKTHLQLLDEKMAELPTDVYQPSAEPMMTPVLKLKDEEKPYGFSVQAGKLVFTPPEGLAADDPSIPNVDEFNEKDVQRFISAVNIRDAVQEMFLAERNGCSDEELQRHQARLNQLYDEHVQAFGRLASDKGLERYFRKDPGYPLLVSLETFEHNVFQAKADCFTKRTIRANVAPTHADSAEDALTISMQEKGKVDLAYMAQLTGHPQDSIAQELDGKSIYYDISEQEYKIAADYLSGDVRGKIRVLKERNKELDSEIQNALGELLGDSWDELHFTPRTPLEEAAWNKVHELRALPKNTSMYEHFLAGSVYMNNVTRNYLKEHENDRTLHLVLAAAGGNMDYTPERFRNDPLFALDLIKCGAQPDVFQRWNGAELINTCLYEMNKREWFGNDYPASASFAPAYNFLYQEPTEHPVSVEGTSYSERREMAMQIAGRWKDYKEKYDSEALKLFKESDHPVLKALRDEQLRIHQNLTALEEVKPKDIPASEISVNLGTTWIPPQWITDFLDETLDLDYYARQGLDVQYEQFTGNWHIDGKNLNGSSNQLAWSTFGTEHINAVKLCEQALNLKQPHIYKTIMAGGEEKRVIDPEATMEAQMKQEELKEAFTKWVWKSERRSKWITEYYNEHFNNIVPREFTGKYLTFPGMAPEYEASLRDYQKAAIEHSLNGNTLFAHCVGAGKTWEMICSAMESKRLGIAHKPMIIVPKQLTEQTGTEFRRLYPDARILVATDKDFKPENRREFFARVATQNWDAVIMGHTQFESISISDERRAMLLRELVAKIVDAKAALKANDGENFSIKEMERVRKKAEARLEALEKKIKDKKDDKLTLCFEDLGIDRLYVDEAHNYKNLYTMTKMSNVAGVQTSHAAKSGDIYEKIQYINEVSKGNGVVFATGTPVSNSMTELYTMQRYLQPEVLEAQGIGSFDAWAANYGKITQGMELKPEGKGFQEKTRFSKFCNLPELMATYKNMADVKTQEMIHLKLPKCEFIVCQTEASEQQKEMVNSFAERAEAIRQGGVDNTVDNMLKVTNDGRALALDQRVFDPSLPDDPNSKVNQCVKNVLDVYRETEKQKSAQLIFCDHSTPGAKNGFSVYEDIKKKLVAQGVKPEEIEFIQNAKTDMQKDKLFKKVREGKVRVLIGGTDALGTGVNVQDRLIATHDLEVPWKPSDLEQRLGRLVRSGNMNENVKCFRYITKGTFDAYMWQILENKQRFISQIMTSKDVTREAEDCDETTLTYAEVKALATGEPLIKEKMEVDNRLNRLKIARSSYITTQEQQRKDIKHKYPEEIDRAEKKLKLLQEAKMEFDAQTKKDENGVEIFSMTINGKEYDKKEEATKALSAAIKEDAQSLRAEYKGFHIAGAINFMTKQPILNLTNKVAYTVDVYGNEKHLLADVIATTAHLKSDLEFTEKQLETTKHDFEVAKNEVDKPFAHEDEFQQLTDRAEEITLILQVKERGIEDEEEIQQEVRVERLKSVIKDFDFTTNSYDMDFSRLPSDVAGKFYLTNVARTMKRYSERMEEGKPFYEDLDRLAIGQMLDKNMLQDEIVQTIHKYSPALPNEEETRNLVSEIAAEKFAPEQSAAMSV